MEPQTEPRLGSPPAPGKLMLLEGFLNTSSAEQGIEDFTTAMSTDAWLRIAGLWTGARKITSNQHREILNLRRALRNWILDKTDFEPLNDLVAGTTFKAEFGAKGEVQFRSVGDDYQKILGALSEVISNSQQEGTWDRFRCCELPTCGWAFYDSTRSRTKRWCSMKTCGSRHKAREYYKRKR